jgi:hypothetical protein
MLTLTVAQAKEAAQNQPISGLKGRVKVVFKPRTGQSNGRDWSNQGIVVADLTDPKEEVTLTVWNQAEYGDNIKGKVIQVMPGPKGGLKGGGTYEKNGKQGPETIYKVDADKSCDITFDDAGGQTQQAPRPTQQSQPPQRTSAPAGIAAAPEMGLRAAVRGVSDWETFLAKEKQIMMRCVQAAAKLAKDEEGTVANVAGAGLDAANIVSLAVAIRISGERHGLGVNSPLFAPQNQKSTSHPPEDPGQDGSGDDDQPPY